MGLCGPPVAYLSHFHGYVVCDEQCPGGFPTALLDFVVERNPKLPVAFQKEPCHYSCWKPKGRSAMEEKPDVLQEYAQDRQLAVYSWTSIAWNGQKGRTMDARVTITFLLAAVFYSDVQTPAKAWDGFITDTHCGIHCQRTAAMTPDRACVRLCVRKGSKYGLWYENHVYALEPQSKASQYAAMKVRIVGNLSNDVITIRSITSIPAIPAAETQR